MRPPVDTRSFAFGVVLLAAGRSSRMGRPKLLLPWGKTTVLGALVAQWRGLGSSQIVVVIGADQPALAAELERLRIPATERVLNPAPERGMFSSIQVAAQWSGWSARLTHCIIALGDQPHLRHQTLQRLLALAADHRHTVCQPARGSRARHPVLLPWAIFKELAHSPAPTLKEFLTQWPITVCELADPGLDLDMDSPGDYQKALELARPELGQNSESAAPADME